MDGNKVKRYSKLKKTIKKVAKKISSSMKKKKKPASKRNKYGR